MAAVASRVTVPITEVEIVPAGALTNVLIEVDGGEIYIGPTGVTKATGYRLKKGVHQLNAMTSQIMAISAEPNGKSVGVSVFTTG